MAAMVWAGLRVRVVRGGAHEAGQDGQSSLRMDVFDDEADEADKPTEASHSMPLPSPSNSDFLTPTAQHAATRSESERACVGPDVGISIARSFLVQLVDLTLEGYDVGGVRNDPLDYGVEGLVRRIPRVLILQLAQNVLLLEHLAGIAELLHNGGDHRVLDFAEKLRRIRERVEEGGHEVRALCFGGLLHCDAMRRQDARKVRRMQMRTPDTVRYSPRAPTGNAPQPRRPVLTLYFWLYVTDI